MSQRKQSPARREPFRDSDPFRDTEEWDPFRLLPMRSLRLPRWADEFFSDASGARGVVPAIDVAETKEGYDISVEVPGVKKDDITVECHEGVLSVRGEKKSEREEKGGKACVLERVYGAFRRSLTLPPDADANAIEASYRDGVLHVAIKKRPESKVQTVSIGD